VANAKKLGLLVSGAASQKFMQALPDQQEICGALADMIIEAYAWILPGAGAETGCQAEARLPLSLRSQ